jgi:preprotein translocase subunit YajC
MSAPLVFAQATNAVTGAAGGVSPQMMQIVLLVGMFALFYFLMIRPQQKRMKEHRAMITGVKRNDTVVLSSGVIGKVVRVEDAEVGVEIATGVTIKVVKSMIAEIRVKGAPAAANDAKA